MFTYSPDASAELLKGHVPLVLALSPHAADPDSVDELELPSFDVRPLGQVLVVVQHPQQELPQQVLLGTWVQSGQPR